MRFVWPPATAFLGLAALSVLVKCEGGSTRSAWTNAATTVSTNAPVLRWSTKVDSRGTFAYTIDVHNQSGVVWTSGEVWQGNFPPSSPAFPGLCVYEGPELLTGGSYTFSVTEQQAADGMGHNISTSWPCGNGSFTASNSLPSAKTELIAELENANHTKLWNTSMKSIIGRVEPSGFLPTSVSNSYGGITSEFVRDGAGMIIGILELGPQAWPTARKAMRFMLQNLQCTQNVDLEPGCSVKGGIKQPYKHPPQILNGNCPDADRKKGICKYNTKITSVSAAREETDGALYVIAGWGRTVAVTGDTSLEVDFYQTLKTYMTYYFAPGAKSSTGTPYWNDTLGLLWNPDLEHSRLTRGWVAYDSLTNSFAIEAIRYMVLAAERQEPASPARAAVIKRWTTYRDAMVNALNQGALQYQGVETQNKPIYAELIGHVKGMGGRGYPLLFGMSWVQLAVTNALLSNLSSAGGTAPLQPLAGLGIDPDMVDNTFDTYAKSGSFLWLTEDIEHSALVQTTNVNSSQLRNPPYRPYSPMPAPSPVPAPTCKTALHGKAALALATGPDSRKQTNLTEGECCDKCAAAGLSVCESWFYRGDTTECFFKLDAGPDHVTKPETFFASGYSNHWTPHFKLWCQTVSWPFGGTCDHGCPCPARVVIGKGLGWETGWAAHRGRWTRLIAITRWLGTAHHVEKQPLFGEDLDYDCLRAFEHGTTAPPSNGRCWGDAGNGVQIGWWVWGQALMRRELGLL
jgi:hypothetical protein